VEKKYTGTSLARRTAAVSFASLPTWKRKHSVNPTPRDNPTAIWHYCNLHFTCFLNLYCFLAYTKSGILQPAQSMQFSFQAVESEITLLFVVWRAQGTSVNNQVNKPVIPKTKIQNLLVWRLSFIQGQNQSPRKFKVPDVWHSRFGKGFSTLHSKACLPASFSSFSQYNRMV